MRIAAIYPFNNGEQAVRANYPDLLQEIEQAITAVDASACRVKKSKEKTMLGEILYSPVALNKCFKSEFYSKGWRSIREKCDYPTDFYVPAYHASPPSKGAFREMDFVKRKLGVEVQFGKYSFMVYNVAAIFQAYSSSEKAPSA